MGRALLEGASEVKLFGETVHVAAEICQMPGISGHADVNGLIDWVKAFGKRPKKVFITHGEDSVTEIFAKRLAEDLGYDTMAPFSGTIYDLAANTCIYDAQGVKIEKAYATPKATKAVRTFEKLVSLGQRLMTVIRKNEGCPNKELDRFSRKFSLFVTNGTEQIFPECRITEQKTPGHQYPRSFLQQLSEIIREKT